MTVLLIVSVIANIALLLVCVLAFRIQSADKLGSLLAQKRHQKEKERVDSELKMIQQKYAYLTESVISSLLQIHEDINKNYMHLHRDDVLENVAHILREQRNNVLSDGVFYVGYWKREIEKKGGEEFVSPEATMDLGQVLSFGWKMHANARENAEEINEVIAEDCLYTDQTAWLSKVLAMYERICDHKKDVAIMRLRLVIEAWERGNEPYQASCMHRYILNSD